MTTITLIDPPTGPADVIANFTALGLALKSNVEATEAHVETWFPGKRYKLFLAHWLLDKGGYSLEDVCGVPDTTFGAGGSGKGSGGGG